LKNGLAKHNNLQFLQEIGIGARAMKTVWAAIFSVSILAAGATVVHAEEPKAALGVNMIDNSLPGVQILSVIPDSPAARIGLEAGDRILAINGKPTSTYHDVSRIIDASRPNTPIELTVARGVWQGKLTAQLGSEKNVFSPTALRSVQQPVPAVTAPAAVYYVPAPTAPWQFPNNMFDNGSRGAAASYGGGGY
jgi:membrane-associated protease RseP (regulator of RpoE activity)